MLRWLQASEFYRGEYGLHSFEPEDAFLVRSSHFSISRSGMAAEVAPNCVAGNVGPRSDECGCSLLVGHRAARNCILGTHLADERHGQGSGPVAEAGEQQGYSMGDVRGDHPLLAVLRLREEGESARLWRGTARKSIVVGTHLSDNRRTVFSELDV